jgi:osmotically-inducible protein OsmY
MSKHWTIGSITAAAVLLGVPAFADQPEDAYLTTKVKMELLTSEGVEPLHINVDTLDGVVTLHGQVETAAAKTKAADEAAP